MNVQWGGYATYAEGWETLSATVRRSGMWCNVIGIPWRYETVKDEGRQLRPSMIIPALQYGAHSYSVMPSSFPRNEEGSGGAGSAPDRVVEFDPGTWCYAPAELEADAAHARSFNAVQDALRLARSSILDGSFYSALCARVPGLRVSLEQIMRRSAASRDPAQAKIL